jgi:hypothetical protein
MTCAVTTCACMVPSSTPQGFSEVGCVCAHGLLGVLTHFHNMLPNPPGTLQPMMFARQGCAQRDWPSLSTATPFHLPLVPAGQAADRDQPRPRHLCEYLCSGMNGYTACCWRVSTRMRHSHATQHSVHQHPWPWLHVLTTWGAYTGIVSASLFHVYAICTLCRLTSMTPLKPLHAWSRTTSYPTRCSCSWVCLRLWQRLCQDKWHRGEGDSCSTAHPQTCCSLLVHPARSLLPPSSHASCPVS